MVILFSERKNKIEQEIIEILLGYGANYISDKMVSEQGGKFTIISEYKKASVHLEKGIAVFVGETDRFDGQIFPKGIVGVCEDTNINALEIFRASNIPVISCGMSSKNTITLSSLDSDCTLAALQRTVTDRNGKSVEPGEFRIILKSSYSPYSIMAATAVLLLNGITPEEF